MLKKDFWYDLPKELIAQEPADPRDSAPDDGTGTEKAARSNTRFSMTCPGIWKKATCWSSTIPKCFRPGCWGPKVPTGAVCELLLLRQVKGDTWECLARPGKRMQVGTKVSFWRRHS